MTFWIGRQAPQRAGAAGGPLEHPHRGARPRKGATFEYTGRASTSWRSSSADTVPGHPAHLLVHGRRRRRGQQRATSRSTCVEPARARRSASRRSSTKLSRDLEQFTGVRAFPAQPPTIGERRAGQPVQFVLKASRLRDPHRGAAEVPAGGARGARILRFVDSDLKFNKPEVSVHIDRGARPPSWTSRSPTSAAPCSSPSADSRFGYFLKDGKQYQVIGQLGAATATSPTT